MGAQGFITDVLNEPFGRDRFGALMNFLAQPFTQRQQLSVADIALQLGHGLFGLMEDLGSVEISQ